MRAKKTFELFCKHTNLSPILDIGSGEGYHAKTFITRGYEVATISLAPPADYVEDFLKWQTPKIFSSIWACHVLEHQRNPGLFLDKCFEVLKPGGLFAITVPPLKHNIVGGHVGLWNEGLLLYHLILAGFDCSQAKVLKYGYNISVLVRKVPAKLPQLTSSKSDIKLLAEFFPFPVYQGFKGNFLGESS